MQTARLGNSDLNISRMGVGAWAMGGSGWAFSWSKQDDKDSIAAIHAALDAGMNWIDTAAVYGLGHSEEVVARAIATYNGPRPYVFTKCERTWDSNGQIVKSLQPDSIKRECEASLKRLDLDVIDLYQIHWPEPDEDIEKGWEALLDLQRSGKVRWIGVSNFNVNQLQRAQSIGAVTSLQPPYSLVRREVETEILPYAFQQNIGVIAYSPMGSGLLTGAMTKERLAELPPDDWRRKSAMFQTPLIEQNLKIAATVEEIAREIGRLPGEVAIAAVLRNQAVTGAIVGFRNAKQVNELARASELVLSDEIYSRLTVSE